MLKARVKKATVQALMQVNKQMQGPAWRYTPDVWAQSLFIILTC